MEEAREKKYLEIPLSKILKFRPYRRLLFCIYILLSHDEITLEEIQQISIVLKLLKISRDFGGSVSVI